MADDAAIAQLMEITGGSREAAARALEAAGPGGLELAVDLMLSTMVSDMGAADDYEPSPPACKMVVLVRQDLGMSVGKACAQVSHATLGAYKQTKRTAGGDEMLEAWNAGGEPTIVLKVDDEAQLQSLLAQAEANGLVAYRVADAGRTEVAAGTVTCAAIGPAAIEAIDAVTGRLSLLA